MIKFIIFKKTNGYLAAMRLILTIKNNIYELVSKINTFIIIAFCFFSCSNLVKNSFNDVKSNEEIKIKYDKHLYVKSIVNDSVEGNFVFDTGTYRMSLDSTFYSNFKIKNVKTFNQEIIGVGLDNQMVKFVTSPLYFKIGSLKYIENLTPIIPLKSISGKKIDGIIGYAAFKDNIVKISYRSQNIQIIDTLNFSPPLNYSKIPFRIENNSIYLNLRINISDSINVKGDFLLDTGGPNTIVLTSDVLKQYDLKNAIKNKVEYYSNTFGIGGSSSGCYFTSKSIAISEFNIENQIISASYDITGGLSKQDFLGILGNKILEKFELIIDFPHKLLYIRPNNKFNIKSNNELLSLGFDYIDRTDIKCGWIVALLYKESNAERAGLKLGDIITHFDDTDVSKIDSNDFKQKLAKIKKQIKLTINRKGLEKEIIYIPKKTIL